jgi:hypothetical protein
MLVDDGEGVPVTEECMFYCAPGFEAACEDDGCRHPCHEADRSWLADPVVRDELDRLEAEHARVRDARPDVALEAVARDLEAENRPDVAELLAERYGVRRRSA